ncbi:MAG TPA: Gfo/Idh/MocA family oxidoreductase [Acidimicrobiia bacterium]|nr:Gfo/Idh/MocA family oxidoreductase [Acidimicrobiia bacterium]
MSEKHQVRLALIGLGWWGGMLATAAAQRARLVAVYARDQKARDEFALRHATRSAPDLAWIWSDPEIDGVIIATPHSVRSEVVEAAARAGKHVFVEKPLALTVEEAERCIRATESAGVVLQVGHNKRRQTGIRAMKTAIDSGEIGQLQAIETNISIPIVFRTNLPQWRQESEHLPAGGMTPLGVHMVDTIQYLGGPIETVFAMITRLTHRMDLDDTTICLFHLAEGPLATLSTLIATGPVHNVTVFGTEQILWAEQDGLKLFRQIRGDPDRAEVPVEPVDTLVDELGEFVHCIQTGARPETGGSEALSVVEALEAILLSADTGATVPVSHGWVR